MDTLLMMTFAMIACAKLIMDSMNDYALIAFFQMEKSHDNADMVARHQLLLILGKAYPLILSGIDLPRRFHKRNRAAFIIQRSVPPRSAAVLGDQDVLVPSAQPAAETLASPSGGHSRGVVRQLFQEVSSQQSCESAVPASQQSEELQRGVSSRKRGRASATAWTATSDDSDEDGGIPSRSQRRADDNALDAQLFNGYKDFCDKQAASSAAARDARTKRFIDAVREQDREFLLGISTIVSRVTQTADDSAQRIVSMRRQYEMEREARQDEMDSERRRHQMERETRQVEQDSEERQYQQQRKLAIR